MRLERCTDVYTLTARSLRDSPRAGRGCRSSSVSFPSRPAHSSATAGSEQRISSATCTSVNQPDYKPLIYTGTCSSTTPHLPCPTTSPLLRAGCSAISQSPCRTPATYSVLPPVPHPGRLERLVTDVWRLHKILDVVTCRARCCRDRHR